MNIPKQSAPKSIVQSVIWFLASFGFVLFTLLFAPALVVAAHSVRTSEVTESSDALQQAVKQNTFVQIEPFAAPSAIE